MLRDAAERLLEFLYGQFAALLLATGSAFSLASLSSALCIAILFLLLRRRPDRRQVRYRVMGRALFPRWLRRASFRADVAFLLLNTLFAAMLFGWAILSTRSVAQLVSGTLTGVFGVRPETGLNALVSQSIVTVVLFLTYELGYWVDHYLSHRIPVLWEFHKVHHTAEVLSPLTNFRMHPVNSVVFANILALFLGVAGGVVSYLQLGQPFQVGGTNLILVAFYFVTVHLQHSHLWIATTGLLGRVILSPAHHQIHHSDKPIHFDRNFGSCLSIWDWMFGTLHMPERTRERLTFGVGARVPDHHTARGSLIMPFVQAASRLRMRPHHRGDALYNGQREHVQ
jgi:sterol desaturase/sphingolipid hydroxylase (fatty acid hydroxylase superfamily)